MSCNVLHLGHGACDYDGLNVRPENDMTREKIITNAPRFPLTKHIFVVGYEY